MWIQSLFKLFPSISSKTGNNCFPGIISPTTTPSCRCLLASGKRTPPRTRSGSCWTGGDTRRRPGCQACFRRMELRLDESLHSGPAWPGTWQGSPPPLLPVMLEGWWCTRRISPLTGRSACQCSAQTSVWYFFSFFWDKTYKCSSLLMKLARNLKDLPF